VTPAEDFRRAPLPADLDRLLHDLRGPLNAAVLHLQALKRRVGEDESGIASLQSIQREVDRLAAMLPAAFSVCALELGALRPLALRGVVDTAIDDEARARVQLEPGDWPEIIGDERLLAMAIREVVLNAFEAGNGDGVVRVGAEPVDNDRVALVVRDSGPGFKTKNPSAIVRLMASGKPNHAGLGLLIAQRVVRLHGGALTFESTPAGGVVRLTLPVCKR
jgi:signal transduction histidine kinase